MKKGICYYTDNKLQDPLFSLVQDLILEARLPIVSCSLKAISFGENIVVNGSRGYVSYINQILTALMNSKADHVFFCEHDVLYPKSHFDFIPPEDNIFYYNENVWRWWDQGTTAIRYERMLPLSCMCVNRKFAIKHYKIRQKEIYRQGLDQFRSREPRFARLWGYEPGTKKKKRGGLTDDDFDTWSSKIPVIDVRYKGTFSSPKIHIEDFKHEPKNWQEIDIKDIKGWKLQNYYELINTNTK